MSLVDYASSSGEEDDDDVEADAIAVASVEGLRGVVSAPTPPSPSADRPTEFATSATRRSNISQSSENVMPAIELPDASLLFASPIPAQTSVAGNNHASRVAAAISENAARKREANGTSVQLPQNKHPRGNFPSRYVPGRSNSLIPPQLLGRSNVATEDISKLFVSRRPPV